MLKPIDDSMRLHLSALSSSHQVFCRWNTLEKKIGSIHMECKRTETKNEKNNYWMSQAAQINKHKCYPSMSMVRQRFETTNTNYGDFACRSGKSLLVCYVYNQQTKTLYFVFVHEICLYFCLASQKPISQGQHKEIDQEKSVEKKEKKIVNQNQNSETIANIRKPKVSVVHTKYHTFSMENGCAATVAYHWKNGKLPTFSCQFVCIENEIEMIPC